MRNVEALEMINSGRIEELKKKLQDEIYAEALKNKPGASKRFAAMKKYFTYTNSTREALQKPCLIDYGGKPYTSFTNGYSLVLTKEPCGSIEMFTDIDRYPDVIRLIRYDGIERKLDLAKVFAEAKSKGYKLKKSELDSHKFKYLMRYDGGYFKLGLVDAAYSIVNDSEEAVIFHVEGRSMPMTIQTSVGVCLVLPIRIEDPEKLEQDGVVIIDVDI